MDTVKTGSYIASKRRALGLTQKQLAEKLGMSDKSVSKWERGICMPDASLYMELCGILGISINEFFAGEDICAENMVQKSEDNLIQVSRESSHKQRKLKGVIALLIVISFVTAGTLGIFLYRQFIHPTNCITPVTEFSTEARTVMMLAGIDDALLFEYSAVEEYRELTVYLSRYEDGKLVEKESVACLGYQDMRPAEEGLLALVPDYEKGEVTLILATFSDNGTTKVTTEIPILEGVEKPSDYGRGTSRLESAVPLVYNTEQGLAALVYGVDMVDVIGIGALGEEEIEANSSYIYYFSIEFSK